MGKTWIIFENKTCYAIECSLYKAPKGHPKPVDCYLVTEHEGDFTIAARKAVHAVHDFAVRLGMDLEPVVAGFDLSERTSMDSGLSGQSGGLSFAISFAQKLFRQNPGKVAATGVVKAGGIIGPVKGIETKIETAAALVQDEGIIFFPRRNANDLSKDLETRLNQQGIRYLPVNSLDEVFDVLFHLRPVQEHSGSKKGLLYLLLLILSCAGVLGLWYFYQNKNQALPVQAPELKTENKTVPVTKDVSPVPEPLPEKPVDLQMKNDTELEQSVRPGFEKKIAPVEPPPVKLPPSEIRKNKADEIPVDFRKSDDKGFD